MSFLDGLNGEQQEVVVSHDTPTLVLAGPGTGKTRAATHRTAYLIEELGAAPKSIMSLTFTNKAGNEFRSRLRGLVGDDARDVLAGTFHSLFLEYILKPCAEHPFMKARGLGDGYSIIDGLDQQNYWKRAEKMLNSSQTAEMKSKDISGRELLSIMGLARSWGFSVDDLANKLKPTHPRYQSYVATIPMWRHYEAMKQADNAIDFDDILVHARDILINCPDVRGSLQGYVKHFIVDEFQDTNKVQFDALQALVGDRASLCAVGDAKQSVYKFRGSSPTIMSDFIKAYPNTNVISLHKNYRSTVKTIDLCNQVTASMPDRMIQDINLVASSEEMGADPIVEQFKNDGDEANWIVEQICTRLDKGTPPQEIAVLYRKNIQRHQVEKALIANQIPFKVSGDTAMLQRKVVKDMIALWKAAFLPWDHAAVRRVVASCPIGITLKRLNSITEETGEYPRAALEMIAKSGGGAGEKIERLLTALSELSVTLEQGDYERSKAALTDLMVEYIAPPAKQESLPMDALNTIIEEFCLLLNDRDIKEALEQLSFMSDIGKTNADAVQLMTIHASKGLEFESVFLLGADDAALPGNNAEDPASLQEERRLLFVAISRAKKEVAMSMAFSRQGGSSRIYTQPSRFLFELGLVKDERERNSALTSDPAFNTPSKINRGHRTAAAKPVSQPEARKPINGKHPKVFASLMGDPNVQGLVDRFGAKIVSCKPT